TNNGSMRTSNRAAERLGCQGDCRAAARQFSMRQQIGNSTSRAQAPITGRCAHRTAPQKGLAARVIAAPLRASFPCVSRSATLFSALKHQ
ncbi:hypothetical protein NLA05_06425, partial [Xanthomonas citri pv. anacardii]|uniref:hypothetical protein n=1 Tax=Xanthomonas citri TaxID=346 RepID=UPI0021C0826B